MGKAGKDAKAPKAKGAKGKQAGGSGGAEPAAAKSKPVKKGKNAGTFFGDGLERELAAVGLRVAKITADGNCLFRAVGDQLEGDEGKHADLRQRACDLMAERREEFEPFVEDDQGFDPYLKRMRKDGVWGGHLELQALSLLTGANIYVYQEGQPRWTVRNHPDTAPAIHISYHGAEHYNSVRHQEDYSRGPPKPIVLGEGGATAAQHAQERASWTPADEARVAANTGCDNPGLITKALREAGGNVDSAIERVIEVMAGDGEESAGAAAADEAGPAAAAAAEGGGATAAAAGSGGSAAKEQQQASGSGQAAAAAGGGNLREGGAGGSGGAGQPGSSSTGHAASTLGGGAEQQQDSSEGELEPESEAAGGKGKAAKGKGGRAKRGVSVGVGAASVVTGAKKPPARNKACPCGSGKKFKGCCAAAAAAADRRRVAAAAAGAVAADGALPSLLATLHI